MGMRLEGHMNEERYAMSTRGKETLATMHALYAMLLVSVGAAGSLALFADPAQLFVASPYCK